MVNVAPVLVLDHIYKFLGIFLTINSYHRPFLNQLFVNFSVQVNEHW